MRTQNVISASVFGILLVAYGCMQLLNLFPDNALLWYLNINFAREARPVFELFDLLPVASALSVAVGIFGLLGLCWLAARKRHMMMTAVTTHTALFCAIFASIASYGANMGAQISSTAGLVEFVRYTTALQPVEQAMAAMVAILLVTCLSNHLDILRELVTDYLNGKNDTAA